MTTERVRLRDDKRLGPKPMSQRVPTIDTALTDRQLLGAALGDPSTWTTWRVVLKSAFGIQLNEAELATFKSVAGDRSPPKNRVREMWVIAGRRSGKSRVAALTAVYLATFQKYQLARGEVGMVLVLAASQAQAKTVFNYVVGFLEASPILRQEIANITATEVTLRNGIVIGIHSNSFRTIRGRTLCGVIMDEISFWRDESSANPDIETYTALLPSLLTTDGLLVGISTPYRKLGLLHAKHKQAFGQNDDEILVVQGSSTTFNATLSEKRIEAQRAADPTGAISEFDALFRNDISALFDDEQVEQATDYDRPLELPPMPNTFYRCGIDPAGGAGADSYCIAIGHKSSDGKFVIDVVRGTKGKYDPQLITEQYAALALEYRCSTVYGDSYSAEWVKGAFTKCNVNYIKNDLPKSGIYLEVVPLFARGLVKLPNHHQLLRELRLLERHTHRSGKDSIDHGKSGHDDYANACAIVLRQLSNRLGYDFSLSGWNEDAGAADNGPSYSEQVRNSYILACANGLIR